MSEIPTRDHLMASDDDSTGALGTMERMPTVPVIAVCGPIGSGKSTVTPALAVALGFYPWLERVGMNPFFRRYMADRPAWAFRSQLAFMIGALEDAAAARSRPPGALLERPAQEMFGVFVQFLHAEGFLATDEVGTLGRLLDLGERVAGVPDVLVVLHGDPRKLLERVRARGRPGEETYTLRDMERLETTYLEWTSAWTRSSVIEIDTTKIDLRVDAEVLRLASQVREALDYPPG